jgi:hypothetical protein
MNGEKKNVPEKKFRAGEVVASIWNNPRSFNGQERQVKSVSVERRYKDKDGAWRSSTSFGVRDIPLVKFVLDEAYAHILTERQGDHGVEVDDEDMSASG